MLVAAGMAIFGKRVSGDISALGISRQRSNNNVSIILGYIKTESRQEGHIDRGEDASSLTCGGRTGKRVYAVLYKVFIRVLSLAVRTLRQSLRPKYR